jgi:uncharacterized protein (TIGR00369 family)
VQWSEPAVWRERPRGATVDAAALALTGLEQLRAIRALPAMYHLTGTRFESVAPREAIFTMPVTGWLLSPQGAVPGGVLALPGDGALGCAIHTELPSGSAYTTAELSITYLRPVTVGTRVRAHGRALHIGRSLAFSNCDITDQAGALIAHATSRCIVFHSAENAPRRSGTALPPPVSRDGDEPASDLDPFMRAPAGTVLDQAVWDSTSGIDVLRGQIDGTLPAPPLHHLLGLAPVSVADGSAECVMPLSGWLNTPRGWPQGGFIAVLADTALGMAVQTTVRRPRRSRRWTSRSTTCAPWRRTAACSTPAPRSCIAGVRSRSPPRRSSTTTAAGSRSPPGRRRSFPDDRRR